MERWQRGQLESLKLKSKTQAAMLRRHVAAMIQRRDALVQAAVALVKGTASSKSGASDGVTRRDIEAAQELLDRQRRLNNETKDFNAIEALVEERPGGEIKFLRRECQAQAELLENVQALKTSRESKLRRMAARTAKLLGLLKEVRQELVEREEHEVPKEVFQDLEEKYLEATRKIKAMSAAAMGEQAGGRDACEKDVAVAGDMGSALPPQGIDVATMTEDFEAAAAEEVAVKQVARLASISEDKDQAIRDLAARAASERAAHGVLAAEVRSQLSAMPSVITDLVEPLKSRLRGVEDRIAEVRGQYAREHQERRRLHNVVQELRGNIRVFCRCRPMASSDKGQEVSVSFPREEVIQLANAKGTTKSWGFDKVFGQHASQEEVYAEVSPLVTSVMDGFNACIFAYGQVDDVIEISIMEVYNEKIGDLLSETPGDKLEVRQGKQGNTVSGLTTVEVSTLEEVLTKLAAAERRRASASTNLNGRSSRSHMVLSVTVNGVNRNTGATSVGRLNLIDLAGSERTNKSGAEGTVLREAQFINLSLSALGDVISARATRKAYVPYRNSTLTRLLQDSLSADSKTLMVVCLSPAMSNVSESSCSLNFASRVRGVELGKSLRYHSTLIMFAMDIKNIRDVIPFPRYASHAEF